MHCGIISVIYMVCCNTVPLDAHCSLCLGTVPISSELTIPGEQLFYVTLISWSRWLIPGGHLTPTGPTSSSPRIGNVDGIVTSGVQMGGPVLPLETKGRRGGEGNRERGEGGGRGRREEEGREGERGGEGGIRRRR